MPTPNFSTDTTERTLKGNLITTRANVAKYLDDARRTVADHEQQLQQLDALIASFTDADETLVMTLLELGIVESARPF